jgi:signal transduction histidine kinase/DNA-binding response OmpR family regulator
MGLLDTPADSTLDDLVRLAAAVTSTPVALITLIDERRQWFIARHGVEATETPREQSFCAHAIVRPESVLAVEDASVDPRFTSNPLVVGDPHIRFYAGVPLMTGEEGLAIGTLCVLDSTPRTLKSDQVRNLKALARLVEGRLKAKSEIPEIDFAFKKLNETERKLDETIRLLNAILMNLPFGVFVKSMEPATFGQFIVWNAECVRIFERTEKEALGRTLNDVCSLNADMMGASDAIVRDRREPVELPPALTQTLAGTQRWLRTLKAPLFDRDGTIRWLLGVTEDVSKQVRAEQDRQAALRRAEAASLVKSQFLANMSHEIRTPVNGVLGFLNLALEGQVSADVREMVETAKGSAQHLLAIINDILDLSKIESGKLTLEDAEFSLGDALRRSLGVPATDAAAKRVEFVLEVAPDMPDLLRGDIVRFCQMVSNLATNAVKFTKKGEIHVSVDLERDVGPDHKPRIVIAVTDSGIGIPKEKLDVIFLPFSQAEASTTRRFGGTGLGLTICREIARRMGGDISVSSEVGRGSRFEATLALAAQPQPPRAPLRDLSVIVAGAYAPSVAATARALRGLGAVATELTSHDGVTAATKEKVTMVVIDTASSVEDDPSAWLVRLRAEVGAETPVVWLVDATAWMTHGHQVNAARVLRKPVTSSDLRRAIEGLLGGPAEPERGTQAKVAPAVDPRIATLTGTRVLLAEDNPVNARLATRLLQGFGCIVKWVPDGREALAAFLGGGFDVVLLDVQMPEMDGLACARAIREAEAAGGTSRIPIIALTANAMKGNDDECLAAGMDRYVSKPIDRERLIGQLVWARGRADAPPPLAGVTLAARASAPALPAASPPVPGPPRPLPVGSK